jgi:hypothetical protein
MGNEHFALGMNVRLKKLHGWDGTSEFEGYMGMSCMLIHITLKKKKTSDCYCVSFSFGVVLLLPVVYYWWCSGGSVVVQYSWWCGVVV